MGSGKKSKKSRAFGNRKRNKTIRMEKRKHNERIGTRGSQAADEALWDEMRWNFGP